MSTIIQEHDAATVAAGTTPRPSDAWHGERGGLDAAALAAVAAAGYPVGLTIAPIMPLGDWRTEYGALLDAAAAELDGGPGLDLTVECITHRFTPGSKQVLEGWYPRTKLEMDPEARRRKFGRFGAVKYVYPAEAMHELRTWFDTALAERLPAARALYWT